MRRILLSAGCLVLLALRGNSQEAPNVANAIPQAGSAAMAGKMSDANINLFTGVPSISVPIHSYKSNSGIGLSISLDYNGGGVQVNEQPTTVGLSWFLSAGGTITRTVKGMPDDVPDNGYLYAAAIPADWRSNGSKYYHDSIDAEQDIFQFNFPGGSGRFFMGKNGQILVTPFSKIKIIPAFRTPNILQPTTLESFRIIAEDGVKYDFEVADFTYYTATGQWGGQYRSGYEGMHYPVLWYLTKIISPFGNDTIKLNYQYGAGGEYGFKFPQVTYVNNANGSRKTPMFAPGQGGSGSKKISSVEFPDSTTVSFVYSHAYKYSSDYALSKIKIKDTAFRFGYLLGYDTVQPYYPPGHGNNAWYKPIKLQLVSLTPFTAQEKQNGYTFAYTNPLFPRTGEPGDTLGNRTDHWGYYNAIVNPPDTLLPKINGYNFGADRTPNSNAVANSISKIYMPTGGYIKYNYGLNDHYPYTKQANSLTISPSSTTQNNITINQVFNNKHQLQFFLDKSVSRAGSAPISGGGILNLYIKSTDGATTYITSSISLYDLFYSGLRTFTFNLANGTYRLETSLSAGTSISGSFPVNIHWENKSTDNTVNFKAAGGIRINSIESQYTSATNDIVFTTYRYVQEDGKSSGFLGDIPRYDYPYREVINNTNTVTDYTAVSSQPVSPADYAQGSPVGYSRVEVLRSNDIGQNLGKEVYEFTDLRDVNGNGFSNVFPYIPHDIRSFGLGLPKKVLLYDSSGALVKKTVNTYQRDTVISTSSNFKSIKLGHSQTNYSSDPNYPPVTKVKTFIGHEYYPFNGRAYMVYSADTLYQPNGSTNTSWQQMVYDTNYNVIKIITSYDRTRNLHKEQRMYYPYNYTVGGGIGKMRDSSIITQMVSTETWITDDGNAANNRILSAAVTSFRQIGNGDLKPDTIYTLETNKPLLAATIGAFNPAQLNRNTTYIKPQSYFTSYDTKGNLTEMKNLVTGQSSSIIIAHNQQYPVAKVSNAVQADIAYTSFETTSNGNWTVSGTLRDLTDKLTGKKSYNLSNGSITKSGLSSAKQYLLTIWTKTGASISINGSGAGTAITTQGNWNFYSVSLTGITSVTVSGSGLIDELRLHPKTANMVTTAYEPLIGPISTVDANNTVAYSEYDNLNRLKLVRDKDKNIVQKFEFADTTMVVSTAPNWQGFAKECSATNSPAGGIDSLYRDMNLFSDSSGYVKKVYQGYLDCNCPAIVNNPQYKVVNGVCEMGTWGVVSSVYKKVLINGNWEWKWECTYRYCFSDGSQSTYSSVIYNIATCPLTCMGIED